MKKGLDVRDVIMKRFFSSFTPNNFPVSLFIYFTPSYVDAYTFICTKQKMTIFKHYLPKDCFGNIQTRPWIDCNWTRTQNHLVLKRTLDHLAKLTTQPFGQTIWPNWSVWPNGLVFVYELSGSMFESSCSHLNPRMLFTMF